MRIRTLLFMALLLLVGGMVMTSCKDDDKEEGNKENASIVGAWTTGIEETGFPVKERVPGKVKAPQKLSDENPAYYQFILYYTPDRKLIKMWAYYDKYVKLKDVHFETGTYKVKGNQLKEDYCSYDQQFTYSIENNQITLTWKGEDETIVTTYSKMDPKELGPILDTQEPMIIGVWGLYEDKDQYYIKDNDYERLFKIYWSDGTADLLTLYYNDDYTHKKSTVRHGTWSFENFTLHEDFKGKFTNDFLINIDNLYLTEYYTNSKGKKKVFEYSLFMWEEDGVKDIYEKAEELN